MVDPKFVHGNVKCILEYTLTHLDTSAVACRCAHALVLMSVYHVKYVL